MLLPHLGNLALSIAVFLILWAAVWHFLLDSFSMKPVLILGVALALWIVSYIL